LHAGRKCDAIRYARGCCDDYGQMADKAKYWRPANASCDSGDVVCGTPSPAQNKCQRCGLDRHDDRTADVASFEYDLDAQR
jgi:hypothetical protein